MGIFIGIIGFIGIFLIAMVIKGVAKLLDVSLGCVFNNLFWIILAIILLICLI